MVEKKTPGVKSVTLGDVKGAEAASGVKTVSAQSAESKWDKFEKKVDKKLDKQIKKNTKKLEKMKLDPPADPQAP